MRCWFDCRIKNNPVIVNERIAKHLEYKSKSTEEKIKIMKSVYGDIIPEDEKSLRLLQIKAAVPLQFCHDRKSGGTRGADLRGKIYPDRQRRISGAGERIPDSAATGDPGK